MMSRAAWRPPCRSSCRSRRSRESCTCCGSATPADGRRFGGWRSGAPRVTEAPRIAVIVPCFNDGELVAEAVSSVIEREPVELVVVDDASSDAGTADVLDRLRREGVPVVRHARNLGLPAARMTGLRASSAPFVFPLDADD